MEFIQVLSVFSITSIVILLLGYFTYKTIHKLNKFTRLRKKYNLLCKYHVYDFSAETFLFYLVKKEYVKTSKAVKYTIKLFPNYAYDVDEQVLKIFLGENYLYKGKEL